MSLVIICFFLVLLGEKFDLGSLGPCPLLIGLGIEGLGCLDYVIRALGKGEEKVVACYMVCYDLLHLAGV